MSRTSRVATLVVLVGILCSTASVAAASTPSLKLVRYRGYSLRVPASWPVFDLSRQPRTCVRFDRHAVYLGSAGASQNCPAHAVGRSEALLVQPAVASAAGARAPSLPSGPRASRMVLDHGRLVVAATWNRDPGVVRRALGVDRLPPAPAAPSPSVARAAAAPRAHAAGQTTGLGFDPCATPSTGAMSAWLSSPYRTVGVYLGGANMACSQPNLTSSWVARETAAGWHFIPTYVGLQAPTTSCGCATISSSQAAAQGAAAASDAVSRAQAVGIGRGNPIYFDMEAYGTGGSATRTVLAFLAAWTQKLHSLGYISGVYSSGASGITDFVNAQGTSFTEPDDIWIADWNGSHSTADPYVPADEWVHGRVHQYSGDVNQTYGGVTINIDGDYVDGAAAGGGPMIPDGTFVQVPGQAAIYRIAGGAPLLVTDWTGFGGAQPVSQITQAQFSSLNPVPSSGTFLVTTTGRIFRVAGGAPLPVSSWSVFGGPRSSVTVDEWDLENLSNPDAHLRTRPSSGTLVEGLPSKTYWQFTPTGRFPVPPTSSAVQVDDASLSPYPVQPSPVRCVSPQLRRMTISAAQRAITRAHCKVGKIRRPRYVARGHILRVFKQTPAAKASHAAGWRVGFWVH